MEKNIQTFAQQSLDKLSSYYQITNKTAFINNLLRYLTILNNNSFESDTSYQYRLYYYERMFGVHFKSTQSWWDKVIYLFFSKRLKSYESKIGQYLNVVAYNQLNQNTIFYKMMNAIELILFEKQMPSLSDIYKYSDVFSVVDNGSIFINDVQVINNNVKDVLYQILAKIIKTLNSNVPFYTENLTGSDYNQDGINDFIDFNILQTVTEHTQKISDITGSLFSLLNNTTINGQPLIGNITVKADGFNNVDNTSDMDKPVSSAQQTAFELKVDKTTTVNGQPLSDNVVVTKSELGLSNVDNTSDMDKPTSSSTQLVLDMKVDKTTTVNGQPLSGNVVISVSGDNSTKVDKTTTVNGHPLSANVLITKSDVGLSNVDNTSDMNKPTSSSTELALNMKVDKVITVNEQPLSENVVITKSDLGLSNVDNTSDMDKPTSSSTELALNMKVDKVITVNEQPLSENVVITKSDLGLSNVDNTSDMDKPTSSSTQLALDSLNQLLDSVNLEFPTKEDKTMKNTSNGYAGLDSNGLISTSLLPAGIMGGLSFKGLWNASTNNPTITSSEGNSGDYYKVNVAGSTSIDSINEWDIGDWIIFSGQTWSKIDNTDNVNSVNGKTGSVLLNKSDLGLSNVDNTSDMDKPVSSAQQTALDLKADKSITINDHPLSASFDIVKDDLFLGNVDNTSDINKPISKSQEIALNLKEDKSNKGGPNGYASLDEDSKLPLSQLPNLNINLDSLSDVNVESPVNNDILKYNSGSGTWINAPATGSADLIVRNLQFTQNITTLPLNSFQNNVCSATFTPPLANMFCIIKFKGIPVWSSPSEVGFKVHLDNLSLLSGSVVQLNSGRAMLNFIKVSTNDFVQETGDTIMAYLTDMTPGTSNTISIGGGSQNPTNTGLIPNVNLFGELFFLGI